MKVPTWDERWPGRLDWECHQLEAAGMAYVVRKEGAEIEIDITYELGGERFELVAVFPTWYPYFRPLVRTRTGRFAFHQQPFDGDLCLIARDPSLWSIDDSLAELISSQLPKIVAANEPHSDGDDSAVIELEEHVPEPVRENYRYAHPDVVFVDSSWTIPADVDGGILELAVRADQFPLRAVVVKVADDNGSILAEADPRLVAGFGGGRVRARWVRIASPVVWDRGEDTPGGDDGEDYRVALDAVAPTRRRLRSAIGPAKVEITGVVYSDEIRYTVGGDNYGDDWVFVLEIDDPKAKHRAARSTFLIRAMNAGEADLAQRVPQLKVMRDRRATVIGLGALGGPGSLALARASIGHLVLVDGDFVEAGTVVRWPIGLPAAGQGKFDTLHGVIGTHYPYTSVSGCTWRFGGPRRDGNDEDALYDDDEVLDRVLADTNLVFDASANVALNHVLADVTWQRKIPLVVVSATAGAWGGMVVRIENGRTACWSCFNAKLGNAIPLPPEDTSDDGSVVPTACSDMTFTGAGFDLTPVVDEAVRMSVARLCEGGGGYPPVNWDVAVLALRNPDGSPCPATWTTYTLEPNVDCPTNMCSA